MIRIIKPYLLPIALLLCELTLAYCPLDHLFIGCNGDGINGTYDDMKLFVECSYKYHNSSGGERFYKLGISGLDPQNFVVQELGFDQINDGSQPDHPLKDPNRCLEGIRNTDYQIIIECISISDNFKVTNLTGSILLDGPGDTFNHSSQPDTHIHLWYVWRSSQPYVEPNELLWVYYRIYDNKCKYFDSEPFGVAFVQEPLAGDLSIDGFVDAADIERFGYYWLSEESSVNNDYYERADSDMDGIVNFNDFALLANNWLVINY